MWNKGQASRDLLTVAGGVRLDRLYLGCPRCGESRHPLDQRLGVQGYVTHQGGEALQGQVKATRAATDTANKRKALDELAEYFGKRQEHLGYAARLRAGQAIGSGLVEGACKQVIGRRMKQTGARRRVRRANRMATLSCPFHGDTWRPCWLHRLN